MLLRSMFDRVMLSSGQFLIDTEEIELDIDKFSRLVKIALGVMNNHRQHFSYHQIDTGGSLVYTFTDTSTPHGIPDWVADIVPIRILGTVPRNLLQSGAFYSNGCPCSGSNSWLEVKQEFPWVYRNPRLSVPITGEYDCKLVFNHRLKEVVGPDGLKDFEVTTIDDNEDEFFSLLTGKFMRALAMSRRAFTLQDIPLTSDADTLAADGKEMEKEASDSLESKNQRFFLAWH